MCKKRGRLQVFRRFRYHGRAQVSTVRVMPVCCTGSSPDLTPAPAAKTNEASGPAAPSGRRSILQRPARSLAHLTSGRSR